jgi:hypothetical protein
MMQLLQIWYGRAAAGIRDMILIGLQEDRAAVYKTKKV